MKKYIPAFLAIIVLILISSCAAALPDGPSEKKANLILNLEISEEIKEDVTVEVALTKDGSFSNNVVLTKNERTKTIPVEITEYTVFVNESGDYQYSYPETIKIEEGDKNNLTISIKPKATEGDDPIDPSLDHGTLYLDFCNFFDATMKYSIYANKSDEIPIMTGTTTKDFIIKLSPGTYYIMCELVQSATDIILYEVTDDLGNNSTENRTSFTIKKDEMTYKCYYITEKNINTKNSRVVFNPTFGKDLLGENNIYGHNVKIAYEVQYGTELTQKINGETYTDALVNIGFEVIPAQYIISLVALNGEIDVSNKYLIFYSGVWANPETIQGKTETKNIAIYKAEEVEFKIKDSLPEGYKYVISCEQLNKNSPENDEKYRIAYDLPFSIKVSVYRIEDPIYMGTYYEKTYNVLTVGDSTVIEIDGEVPTGLS